MNCKQCSKKLLYSFKCRCKNEYCIKHKLPEKHNCEFDYKQLIKKQEAVISQKVIKI